MATVGEVAKHDDPLALFITAMCMASNDVEAALSEVRSDTPLHGYYVRLAMAHTNEGLVTYDKWRREYPAVKTFLASVNKKWAKSRKSVQTMRHEVGKAMGAARNYTFHYPAPGEYGAREQLSKVLRGMADEEMELSCIPRGPDMPPRLRYDFAERAALALALHQFNARDGEEVKRRLAIARDGCIQFIFMIAWLFAAYGDRQGFRVADLPADAGAGGTVPVTRAGDAPA